MNELTEAESTITVMAGVTKYVTGDLWKINPVKGLAQIGETLINSLPELRSGWQLMAVGERVRCLPLQTALVPVDGPTPMHIIVSLI